MPKTLEHHTGEISVGNMSYPVAKKDSKGDTTKAISNSNSSSNKKKKSHNY